jgi:predicted extracellular nuclease
MKKLYSITCALFLVSASAFSQCNELFISEYVEGSGNDKAIEIYNPTATAIDLSGYSLRRYSNGAVDYAAGGITNLTGTIASFGVFVVVNGQTTSSTDSPACSLELQALADQLDGTYPATTYMNGNDAIVLAKANLIVDILGKTGENPGTAWSSLFPYTGNSGAWITKDHTMIRKESVQNGVTVNPDFFDPLAQYDTLPNNTWTSLGAHNCVCNPLNAINEAKSSSVRIFPNPVLNNELNISSSKIITGIQITNMIGQVVFTSKNQVASTSSMKVVVNELPRGVYYLQTQHIDRSSSVEKIVIR